MFPFQTMDNNNDAEVEESYSEQFWRHPSLNDVIK